MCNDGIILLLYNSTPQDAHLQVICLPGVHRNMLPPFMGSDGGSKFL
jgi:hypothetical protein